MSELLKWASVERTFLIEDINWIEAGAKLISPSGDDVTASKLESLKIRLEHANLVIDRELKEVTDVASGD